MKSKEYWINWTNAAGRSGSPGIPGKKEYALPWEAPTGAHDMYKVGEYMIWEDGTTQHCKQDTNFSPAEYAQAWEVA